MKIWNLSGNGDSRRLTTPAIVGLELNCQMIVTGTYRRSGVAHLLLGRVAEYVVRNSKVPVLTVCVR